MEDLPLDTAESLSESSDFRLPPFPSCCCCLFLPSIDSLLDKLAVLAFLLPGLLLLLDDDGAACCVGSMDPGGLQDELAEPGREGGLTLPVL